MITSRPLEKSLQLIIQQAVEIASYSGDPASSGQIALMEGRRLQCEAAWPPNTLTGLQSLIGDIDLDGKKKIGIIGRVVNDDESIITGNAPQHEDYLPGNPDTISELAVPIRYENHVIGVINVESILCDAFDEYDRVMLKQLADHVATIIQTARNYVQMQHDARVREGLLKVGKFISATRDSSRVLQVLVKRIRGILEADFVSLYTFDPATDQISLSVAHTGSLLDTASEERLSTVSDHSIVREILANKLPVFANDTVHDRLLGSGDFAVQEKIRSSAGIPLLIGKKPVGVLFVNFRQPYKFSEQQQKDLALFAMQIASVLKNAGLVDSLSRRNTQ